MPLTLETTTQTLTAENMRALTANNTLSNDVTVYHSTLNEGATPLFKMDETILAGKKQIGSGAIIQTTFSLGDDPLAKDPVYSDLLSTILQSVNVQNTPNMYG